MTRRSNARRFSLKIVLTTVLKMSFVGGLLWWMISTDKLHLSELSVFVTSPIFLVASFAFWLFFPVLLGSLRWFILLRGAGVDARFLRTMQLQLIGFFFNAAIPGAVGGDLAKAVYVVRDEQGRKTAAMLSILLDRIAGLVGLFSIAFFASLLNLESLLQNPMTGSLVVGLAIGMVFIVMFVALVFFPHKNGRDPFERILQRDLPGLSVLSKIYAALRAYRHVPMVLFQAWVLSVALQVAAMLYFWFTTYVVTGQQPAMADFMIIFPFGAIATAIPVAPGGLGVGHLAYEKLYLLVGLNGGANVFNVFVLGQLTLNLLGFFPWIAMKSKIPVTESVQV
jgi:uncharacterized protein (TIRG00374 family)